MKKIIYFGLPLLMAFTLSSCDWFNTTFLGKPSKAEQELAQLQLEKSRQDSIDLAVANLELQEAINESESQTTSRVEEVILPLNGSRYHILVGSFKEPENADKMMATLQKKDYKPQKVYFKNDFICVSAASSDNAIEMFKMIHEMLNEDFCPIDVWLYDSTTGLHR